MKLVIPPRKYLLAAAAMTSAVSWKLILYRELIGSTDRSALHTIFHSVPLNIGEWEDEGEKYFCSEVFSIYGNSLIEL